MPVELAGSSMSHTYALLEVSSAAYDEVRAKLSEAGYSHAFADDGAIDMHGIALVREDKACGSQT